MDARFPTALVAVLGLLSLAAPAAAQEGAAPLDHINASPTGEQGRYHVMPVFEDLARVEVIRRGGPYGPEHTRVLDPSEDYAFDPAAGDLRVTASVDDDEEMVVVRGIRVRPWAWRAGEPLASVRVLIGDREGVRGEDFAVDLDAGVIRFLKAELCRRDLHYYISYGYAGDAGRGGAIGNHPERASIQRFLGIARERTSPKVEGRVGTNASPTADPRVWTMVRAMDGDTLRVAVAKRDAPGDLRWLERGADYLYDAAVARLALRAGLAPDPATEFLFLHGIPEPRHVFHLHRAVADGAVTVVVGGRTLEEGAGFTVDRDAGTVTVHDEAILDPATRFRISAAGRTFGN